MHLPDSNIAQEPFRCLVIGVGGCGCAVINKMIAAEYAGVTYIAVDSDSDALKACKAEQKVNMLTNGTEPGLRERLPHADMVFVISGMGGATGTKIGPIVAEYAKQYEALTIGVVTLPLPGEGASRTATAERGLSAFRQGANSVVVVPLAEYLCGALPMPTAENIYYEADKAVITAIKSIADSSTRHGLVGLDLADIKMVMKDGSICFLGQGSATGSNRVREAAVQALQSPFLPPGCLIDALGVIQIIEGDSDISMDEVSQATDIVKQSITNTAVIILQTYDDGKESEVSVVIVVCGAGGSDLLDQPQRTPFGSGSRGRKFLN